MLANEAWMGFLHESYDRQTTSIPYEQSPYEISFAPKEKEPANNNQEEDENEDQDEDKKEDKDDEQEPRPSSTSRSQVSYTSSSRGRGRPRKYPDDGKSYYMHKKEQQLLVQHENQEIEKATSDVLAARIEAEQARYENLVTSMKQSWDEKLTQLQTQWEQRYKEQHSQAEAAKRILYQQVKDLTYQLGQYREHMDKKNLQDLVCEKMREKSDSATTRNLEYLQERIESLEKGNLELSLAMSKKCTTAVFSQLSKTAKINLQLNMNWQAKFEACEKENADLRDQMAACKTKFETCEAEVLTLRARCSEQQKIIETLRAREEKYVIQMMDFLNHLDANNDGRSNKSLVTNVMEQFECVTNAMGKYICKYNTAHHSSSKRARIDNQNITRLPCVFFCLFRWVVGRGGEGNGSGKSLF